MIKKTINFIIRNFSIVISTTYLIISIVGFLECKHVIKTQEQRIFELTTKLEKAESQRAIYMRIISKDIVERLIKIDSILINDSSKIMR